jgi:hypothetical protein
MDFASSVRASSTLSSPSPKRTTAVGTRFSTRRATQSMSADSGNTTVPSLCRRPRSSSFPTFTLTAA